MKKRLMIATTILSILAVESIDSQANAADTDFKSEPAKKAMLKYRDRVSELDKRYSEEVDKAYKALREELRGALRVATNEENYSEAARLSSLLESNEKPDISTRQDNEDKKRLLLKVRRLEDAIADKTRNRLKIPREAVKWKGHYYLRIDTVMTKRIAKEYSESLGGHLVRIENSGEQEFVHGLIKNGPSESYMIDGGDEENEGQWVWSNGRPVTYLDWGKNEPNHGRRGREIEHVLAVASESGQMFDGACGLRRGFVIEWER